MTLSILTQSITALSITTISIAPLSIMYVEHNDFKYFDTTKPYFTTLNTQHNDAEHNNFKYYGDTQPKDTKLKTLQHNCTQHSNSIAILRMKTLSILMLTILTLKIVTSSITRLCIFARSIITTIKPVLRISTLTITNTQHNNKNAALRIT
jgi:hypothetical protein